MEANKKLAKISYAVIGLAIEIHKQFGQIKKAGLRVEKEITLPIIYKEITLNHGY